MAPILHWYCQKTGTIADAGAYEFGTPMWMQSVANESVPLRFSIFERSPVVLRRALAQLGLFRPKALTSLMAVPVFGTTVHHSEAAWPLPAPKDSRKRRTFFYRDDHGNESAEVTSAASIDVRRLRRVTSGFQGDAGLLGGTADYLDEDELTFVLNPVIDPSVRVTLIQGGDEDPESMSVYLSALIDELAKDELLSVEAESAVSQVQEFFGDALSSEYGPASYPLWDGPLQLDPEQGQVFLAASLRRRPPWRSALIGLEVTDAESGELLARSDPVFLDGGVRPGWRVLGG